MKKPTPYQKIMRAWERGTGVRFSAEEVEKLRYDDAIATRAVLDDEVAKGNHDDQR